MKILYFSQFFIPERVAAAFRAYDNSRIWKDRGDDVTIFTSYPNFPTGKLFNGYKIKGLIHEEYIDDLRVLRSRIVIKENTTKLKRIFNALSFFVFGVLNIFFNSKKIGENYDVVMGTSGTLMAPMLAFIYSSINKKNFILELRDITYNQLLAVSNGKITILYRIIKKIELFLCRKAKKVVVVTSGFREELIREGIDSKKIEVIFNGLDTELIKVADNNINEEIIFSYMGNVGESQNLLNLVDIFEGIDIKNYKKKLYIIGDGAKKDELINYVHEKKYNNIIIKSGLAPDKLEEFYDYSDFCIVSLKNNMYFTNTIPSKIFQIMGRGKNIIYFGPEGEASKIISEVDSNFIFTNSNKNNIIEELNAKINKIKNLKKYLIDNGKNNRKIVEEKYDRNKLAEKYREILKASILNEV
ncbi:glycosyltransferase family 4 protein [Clostridium sp.]|uniref:glycosyltransferase family 4 protein n=1 Tax=Clostridium sp. TaxID=1506 RepID=UPI0029089310|nr:glycosyltransferase family 4 protein [Clostridium sp.]MDU7215715.1 glycosyltransferase family 4 protein [Clostridium sp.]